MFHEKPLTVHATTPRRLVQGVGINDAEYATSYTDQQGKRQACPYYTTWTGMLKRVYYSRFHQNNPSYIGCTVEKDWHTFSIFRSWMEQQPWKGNNLDKDLLVPGNKHYGPITCIFVPQAINSLTVLRNRHRGQYPLGVVKSTSNGYTYFLAKCSFYGKQRTIGSFKTPEEAGQAYLDSKREYLREIAAQQTDPRVKQALLNINLY